MKISLLPFLPKHLPEVSTLIQQSLHVLGAQDYSTAQIAALVERENAAQHLDRDIFALIAVWEHQIVGIAALQKSSGWGVINAVYVHPNFARQTIGTQLVKALEQEAVQQKCRGVYVAASITGFHLYKNLGYKSMGKRQLTDTLVPVTTILMTKELRPASHWENLVSYLYFGNNVYDSHWLSHIRHNFGICDRVLSLLEVYLVRVQSKAMVFSLTQNQEH